MKIITTDPTLLRIASKAFGPVRKVKLETIDPSHSIDCRSYWDGGSRDSFAFVQLTDEMPISAPLPSQSAYDVPIKGIENVVLPKGVACIMHSVFCGKDSGVTIIVRADDLNPSMLAAKPELSDNERLCLIATRSLKNTYGGQTDLRRKSTGMDQETWASVQAALIARGLLAKSGAITDNGRNAISGER